MKTLSALVFAFVILVAGETAAQCPGGRCPYRPASCSSPSCSPATVAPVVFGCGPYGSTLGAEPVGDPPGPGYRWDYLPVPGWGWVHESVPTSAEPAIVAAPSPVRVIRAGGCVGGVCPRPSCR